MFDRLWDRQDWGERWLETMIPIPPPSSFDPSSDEHLNHTEGTASQQQVVRPEAKHAVVQEQG